MKPDSRRMDWIIDHAMSLGFYAYAFLLAPPLARALKAGLAAPDPLWAPGFLLLAVLLLEPVGLRWKLKFLRRRNADEEFTPEGSMLGIFSAAGIAHVIVTMFVGMLMLDCWGVVGGRAEDASPWWGAVIVGLILKEFVGLFASGGQSVSSEPPGHWKEHLADVFLLAYGCVAYTAWWGSLLDLGEIASEGWAMKVVLLPLLGAFFVFLYLALRLSFLLEEYYLRPSRGRKTRIWTELAIGIALGLFPAFF